MTNHLGNQRLKQPTEDLLNKYPQSTLHELQQSNKSPIQYLSVKGKRVRRKGARKNL
ncbi:hypothetical protein FDUTEX481_07062 [Tolypothrix sp. PCC 7601]|nr:hypothetical protein FDUTEX481_07062 [Tolypothrix sp. PCC 7601]